MGQFFCDTNNVCDMILSSEQQTFIETALQEKNILVDACVGSGKTTSIQCLCNALSNDKSILYLTYNRLLKIDAKAKIKNKNVFVTNYHGFAAWSLKKAGISVAQPELIQRFIQEQPSIPSYDVLIIDEYQDIEQELADLLTYIKNTNPSMQIIAVGDMEQKIYDKTKLDARQFICSFLGEHVEMSFTNCFRLPADFAQKLGSVWGKTIIGVNSNCRIETMTSAEATAFLSKQSPSDILCLGSRKGDMTDVLNTLENKLPSKFNKNTVYASISDVDNTGATQPDATCAIFTTYDSSKGLERKICVVFDFTESYWALRIEKPLQSYEILRNIFCVAASRGKEHIVFVKNGEALLSETTLRTNPNATGNKPRLTISTMFDFKYREDIDECYSLLTIKELSPPDEQNSIKINNKDGLIDLSPCIGIYQEAAFFSGYDIDKDIEFQLAENKDALKKYNKRKADMELDSKILYLTSLETNQKRYETQVSIPFVSDDERDMLIRRLGEKLPSNADVQFDCVLQLPTYSSNENLCAVGRLDAFYKSIVYELKFVSELKHEHFLQCACYILAVGLKSGRLWNTRNNAMYEVEIPDREKFLSCVLKTVTKGSIQPSLPASRPTIAPTKNIAIIDTETNLSDKVMSIGVVIADAQSFTCKDYLYRIITPECRMPAMYSSALNREQASQFNHNSLQCSRQEAIKATIALLNKYQIVHIFAYNARFDLGHLPELAAYQWYDIMGLAAYRQYNPQIPDNAECCKSGRLKRDYGVEKIMRLLSGNHSYQETHNALLDAIDELTIMQLLGHRIQTYHTAKTANKNFSAKAQRENRHASTSIQTAVGNVSNNPRPSSGKRTAESNSTQQNDYIYTVNDICGELKKSRSTVYKLLRSGALNAVKIGNKYYVSKSSFEKYKTRLFAAQYTLICFAVLAVIAIIIMICLI